MQMVLLYSRTFSFGAFKLQLQPLDIGYEIGTMRLKTNTGGQSMMGDRGPDL